jgi:hypothetical protein
VLASECAGHQTRAKRATGTIARDYGLSVADDSLSVTPDGRKIMEYCECQNWARDNIVLLTKHHPKCPKYNVEEEAKAHIEALLNGMIIWANDEDGIHDKCFDAFRSAAYFIGKPELVKREETRWK